MGVESTEDLISQVHDRFYDEYNREPSDEEVVQVIKELPQDILNLGHQWGFHDTEVREAISKWLRESRIY